MIQPVHDDFFGLLADGPGEASGDGVVSTHDSTFSFMILAASVPEDDKASAAPLASVVTLFISGENIWNNDPLALSASSSAELNMPPAKSSNWPNSPWVERTRPKKNTTTKASFAMVFEKSLKRKQEEMLNGRVSVQMDENRTNFIGFFKRRHLWRLQWAIFH